MRIYRHVTANDVRLEPYPFRRELSMQAYLIDNEAVLGLDTDAFSNVEILDAEVALAGGRASKSGDGRIDILASYSQEYLAVIELKVDELTKEHLVQLEDYLKQRHALTAGRDFIQGAEPKWIGVLVGSRISSDLAQLLAAGYGAEDGSIPIAALTLQRFRGSDGSVLVTTDVHFNYSRGTKDRTKYLFLGEEYGKGRLVLAVVKHYVQANEIKSFAELESAFPKECQGTSGVIATFERASQVEADTGHRRHFLAPDSLIKLDDAVVAVSNQWGVGNIGKFLKRAESLGLPIASVAMPNGNAVP